MSLLQTGDLYGDASPDPKMILYFGLGLAGIVTLLLIAVLISRRRGPRTRVQLQRYNSGIFRRAAKAIGLPELHIAVLEDLVRAFKVKQPVLLFTNAGLLDDTLKKSLYSLEGARDLKAEEWEKRRAIIFQIKQIIEGNARKVAVLSSTAFLRPGQTLRVAAEGAAAFSSKVISNMKDFLHRLRPGGSLRSRHALDAGHDAFRVPLAGQRCGLLLCFQGPRL